MKIKICILVFKKNKENRQLGGRKTGLTHGGEEEKVEEKWEHQYVVGFALKTGEEWGIRWNSIARVLCLKDSRSSNSNFLQTSTQFLYFSQTIYVLHKISQN